MKIFWLFNHPAPYKIDFFNELGKKADLDVYFERASEGKRNPLFYINKMVNFKSTICKGAKYGLVNNSSKTPIRALKKHKYDIVVINGWATFTEQKTIKYCKKKKISYIFAINGGIIKKDEPSWKTKAKKKYISGAAGYLCPDENSAEYLTHYGAKANLITYYPYSTVFEREILEKPLGAEEKAALREKFKLTGKKIFISASQFIDRKNNELLLEAWKNVPRDYYLYLVGDGELEKQYKEIIRQNNLSNVFIRPFLPHNEMLKMLRAADAFLFPTKEDIYGHVVNEAFAMGIPVLSSKHANSSLRLIKNGVNGMLLSDVPSAWSDAVKSFNFASMGEACIATAKMNTIELMAKVHYSYFMRFRKNENLLSH